MKINKNICYGNGQLLDCFLPDNEMTSVLVFFHGGGLEGGSKDDAVYFAEYLTARRIGVVSADYRLYPTASYPDFIEDAAKATAWAINEFDTCKNIFIGGSSAGAYLSMMLCFDKEYLAKYDVNADKISGYIFNAGQPTVHFNVLRERGLDCRRVVVDESAPLFHVKECPYPPMLIIVSDNDMECRLEQLMLLKATLKHFNDSDVTMKTVENSNHCQYDFQSDADGNNILGTYIYEFVSKKSCNE